MDGHNKYLSSFSDPEKHKTSSKIIQKVSSNKNDIRDIALQNIDLSSIRNVLDLGCGFGFMSSKVASGIFGKAIITGVDIYTENQTAFLSVLKTKGCCSKFKCLNIKNRLPWEDNSFDLIICSYSLYFFVDIISETARILRPDGIFIAITHSRKAFNGLYQAAGIKASTSPLNDLIRKFSSENGFSLLSPFFRTVEHIKYINTLQFSPEHLEDLLYYVQFKLPLLISNYEQTDNLPPPIRQNLADSLSNKGSVLINKNDAVFRCRSPLCH